MRTLIRYNYSTGFYIYRIWADQQSDFTFYREKGPVSVMATLYKGALTCVAAENTDVIGRVYTSFIDFTIPDNKYHEANNSFQTCSMSQNSEWWCLHRDDGDLATQYLEVSASTEIPANTNLVVLEGTITANDNGTLINATDMNLIKSRPYTYTIDGDAKVFLINLL